MGQESYTSKSGRIKRVQGLRSILEISGCPFIKLNYTKFTEPVEVIVVKKLSESLYSVIESYDYTVIKPGHVAAPVNGYVVLVPKELTWAYNNLLDFTEGYLEVLYMLGGSDANPEFFARD